MKTITTKILCSAKVALMLLMLLCTEQYSSAQIPCSSIHDAPACNLDGPLTACLNGGNITIVTTIQISGPTPQLVYSFPVNTSGAEVVDTNFVSYNGTDSTYVENVIIK